MLSRETLPSNLIPGVDADKGKRMNRIEAVFPLNGELNRYPLDRYRTTLWLLMTAPPRKVEPHSSSVPQSTQNEELQSDQLAVGTTALQQRTLFRLRSSFLEAVHEKRLTRG